MILKVLFILFFIFCMLSNAITIVFVACRSYTVLIMCKKIVNKLFRLAVVQVRLQGFKLYSV